MKTKKISKKLSFIKKTVASLNDIEMENVQGKGEGTTIFPFTLFSCTPLCTDSPCDTEKGCITVVPIYC